MSEPFLGEIRAWGCTYAPRGWATCDGQLLPISQNTQLFAVIGTQFGGDGRTTVALPNLAGGVPVGQGAGPGLTPRQIGERGGGETVMLTREQLPTHGHALRAFSGRSSSATPNDESVFAGSTTNDLYGSQAPDTALATSTVSVATGGGQPHDNMMPYLAVNVCIALEGVFPPRD